jgi:hypothetical protein
MSCWPRRSCVARLPPRPVVTAACARPKTMKTTTKCTWTRGDRAPPRPPSLQHLPLLDLKSSFDLSLLLLRPPMSLRLPLLPLSDLNPTSLKRHPIHSLSNTTINHNHNISNNNNFTCRLLHTLLHPRHLTTALPLSKNIPSTHHNLLAIQYLNPNC